MIWTLTRRAAAPFALALLLLVTGCASGGMGMGGGARIAVVVENNLVPPTSLSVFARSENGVRRLIGVVQPARTVTLSFDPTGPSGNYVFEGETTSGGTVRSTPIVVSEGETVNWNVTSNIATIGGN